ncbi:MAG: hypothetical protein ACR2HN_03270 [Tepidiformaceae bacterium]
MLAALAPRPLQNRVTPFGEIVAAAARGTMMGNRGGCMHDDRQRLRRRQWVNARWITCVLEFRGRHREVMQPRRYTELFFLDEATSFAAGHRPCAECRRGDFDRFREAWLVGNPSAGVRSGESIDRLDAVLHAERVGVSSPGRWQSALAALPPGVMVTLPQAPAETLLWWRGRLLPWSHDGYGTPTRAVLPATVRVLTPPSTGRAFAAGYVPAVHRSAGA